jgi:hypothetical protein
MDTQIKKVIETPKKSQNELKAVFRKQQVDDKIYNKVVVVYQGRDLFSLKLDYSQKQVIDALIKDADYDLID